jgi:hypothetical protein
MTPALLELNRTDTGYYELDFNQAFNPYCYYSLAYRVSTTAPREQTEGSHRKRREDQRRRREVESPLCCEPLCSTLTVVLANSEHVAFFVPTETCSADHSVTLTEADYYAAGYLGTTTRRFQGDRRPARLLLDACSDRRIDPARKAERWRSWKTARPFCFLAQKPRVRAAGDAMRSQSHPVPSARKSDAWLDRADLARYFTVDRVGRRHRREQTSPDPYLCALESSRRFMVPYRRVTASP